MHPFAEAPAATVAALGEVRLLGEIRRWLGPAAPPPPWGMGDDVAIAPAPVGANLFTVDNVLYGRHWDDAVPPAGVGAKLLHRNLSDLAAKGGRPLGAVIALFLPRATSLSWLAEFYRGLAEAARRWQVPIVGGDLTESRHELAASLTLWGVAERPVPRAAATPGCTLWVTGALGGSLDGHHWQFMPRLPEGQWLAQQPGVVSMMDVTDGLAKDLPALLGPGAQAIVDLAALPLTAAARRRPDPRRAAWGDGEDYELLFATAPGTTLPPWPAAFGSPPTAIGFVRARPAEAPAVVTTTGEVPFAASADGGQGYAHFG